MKGGNCKIKSDFKGKLPKTLKKRNPVKGKYVIIDGHKFDSKIEAVIYQEFRDDPTIEILELHPKFMVLDVFRRHKKHIAGISYTPDFKIKIRGRVTVVEVKSIGVLKKNSKSYPMRRKLFLKKYPDLHFREIIFDGKKRTIKDY
jgi:hypothetical protein